MFPLVKLVIHKKAMFVPRIFDVIVTIYIVSNNIHHKIAKYKVLPVVKFRLYVVLTWFDKYKLYQENNKYKSSSIKDIKVCLHKKTDPVSLDYTSQ